MLGFAAVVEIPLDEDLIDRLSHPFQLEINNLNGFVCTQLISKLSDDETLDLFSIPSLSTRFSSCVLPDTDGGVMVETSSGPLETYRFCPSWLHGSYAVPTRILPEIASKRDVPSFGEPGIQPSILYTGCPKKI